MPTIADYPAKDNVTSINVGEDGLAEVIPSDPYWDDTDVDPYVPAPSGRLPTVTDDDGDALSFLDAWIELIVFQDDSEQFLGTDDPFARPSWITRSLLQAVATSGRRDGLLQLDMDTTKFHSNLKLYVIKVQVDDGTNTVEGFFRLYNVGVNVYTTIFLPGGNTGTSADDLLAYPMTGADIDSGDANKPDPLDFRIVDNVQPISALSAAPIEQRIYFGDTSGRVRSAKYDGSDVVTHWTDPNGYPVVGLVAVPKEDFAWVATDNGAGGADHDLYSLVISTGVATFRGEADGRRYGTARGGNTFAFYFRGDASVLAKIDQSWNFTDLASSFGTFSRPFYDPNDDLVYLVTDTTLRSVDPNDQTQNTITTGMGYNFSSEFAAYDPTNREIWGNGGSNIVKLPLDSPTDSPTTVVQGAGAGTTNACMDVG